MIKKIKEYNALKVELDEILGDQANKLNRLLDLKEELDKSKR